MGTPTTSGRLRRFGYLLAVTVCTFGLDAIVVSWLWGNGVDFAILDRVEPGGSGFRILPMPVGYKWLLGAALAANAGLLWYLWVQQRRGLAVAFATGAVLPMAHSVNILFSA